MENKGRARALLVISMCAFVSGCHPYFKDDIMENDPRYAPVSAQQMSPPSVNNGSLYHDGFGISLFDDNTARKVGDVLTVVMAEVVSSASDSTSSTDRAVNLNMPNVKLLSSQQNGLNVPKLFNITTEVGDTHQDTYKGTGSSADNFTVTGSMSVTVSEVYPNGNLRIRGEKWVKLNSDEKYIRLSGIVRPSDIASDNTISSTKIADARINYGGKGLVSENSLPGWIARFFLSPRWPL